MKNKVNILEHIKQIVRSYEPAAKIYLYGSRASGKAKKDSDWDILILINKEVITYELEKRITDPLFELEFDTGEIISPMIYSENEWNYKYSVTTYYQSVMKNAIPI